MGDEKINNIQRFSVVSLLGANRLLKNSLDLEDTVGVQLAKDQINIIQKILGEKFFNALMDQLEGSENLEAENIVKQSREFVDLFKENNE